MKKIAAILVFVFTVQVSTQSFAQSSDPVAETKQLQKCVEKRFEELKSGLPNQDQQKIKLDEHARLAYSKEIIQELLYLYVVGLKGVQNKTRLLGLIGTVSGMMYLGTYLKSSVMSEKITTLQKTYERIRYNGAELAKVGGEEGISAEIAELETAISKMKFFKYGTLGVAIVTGFFAFLYLSVLNKEKLAQDAAQGTLDDLRDASTELAFYQYLSSSDDLITKLRQYSLEACGKIKSDELVNLLKEIDKATPSQIQDSVKQFQKNLDTLSTKK